MRTSGQSNNTAMVLAPVALLMVFAVIISGGPTNALEFVDDAVRTIVYHVDAFVRALL